MTPSGIDTLYVVVWVSHHEMQYAGKQAESWAREWVEMMGSLSMMNIIIMYHFSTYLASTSDVNGDSVMNIEWS